MMKFITNIICVLIFACFALHGMDSNIIKEMFEWNNKIVHAESELRKTSEKTQRYHELAVAIKHYKEKRDELTRKLLQPSKL